jgi:hypothetical protein
VLASPAPDFARAFDAKRVAARSAHRLPLGALASMVAVLAVVLNFFGSEPFNARIQKPETSNGFKARGSGSVQGSRVGFEVYVHEPGVQPTRLQEGQHVSIQAGYSFVVIGRFASWACSRPRPCVCPRSKRCSGAVTSAQCRTLRPARSAGEISASRSHSVDQRRSGHVRMERDPVRRV